MIQIREIKKTRKGTGTCDWIIAFLILITQLTDANKVSAEKRF